jgi:hypothetical protein
MNALARCNFSLACDKNVCSSRVTSEEKLNETLKEVLLHITVAISGLNKLPIYQGKGKYLYRSEKCSDKRLEQRKNLVKAGRKASYEMGFLSSSHTKPSEKYFDPDAKSAIILLNVEGKDISPLAQYPEEQEILTVPHLVKWEAFVEIPTPKQTKLCLFIARPITAPKTSPTVSPKSKQ